MIDLIMAFVQLLFLVLVVLAIPWIKKHVPAIITTVFVNVVEIVIKAKGSGAEKFVWVDKLLQQLIPKLTALEREKLINDIVKRMNEIGEALK